MKHFSCRVFPVLAVSLMFSGPLYGAELPARFAKLCPRQSSDCNAQHLSGLNEVADQLEAWAAELIWNSDDNTAEQVLARLEQLIAAREQIDQCLDRVLRLRTSFAALEASDSRRMQMRCYLQVTSRIIDLSGRLRYLLHDAIQAATYALEASPGDFHRLIELLARYQVQVGAEEVAYVLFDPRPGDAAHPFADETKRSVLRLMSVAKSLASLADLADYLQEPHVTPELTILACETIWQIGVPQEPQETDKSSDTGPVITPTQIIQRLSDLNMQGAGDELIGRRERLLQKFRQRAEQGVLGDTFRYGDLAVRSGDWLLMRNPSPYNLFTDLSPGLFTHVGVVTTLTGNDGKRRFVIVDLPERGTHIPANNVDTYLARTLHFFFLRHTDPVVGERMGQACAI